MTETTLRHYLRISGWAAILATIVQFILNIIVRTQQLSELGVDGEIRSQTSALFTFGFGMQLPIILTTACLCLMASRALTYKHQTLETIFE